MVKIVSDSEQEVVEFLARHFICPIDFEELEFEEEDCLQDCYGCLISNYGLKIEIKANRK